MTMSVVEQANIRTLVGGTPVYEQSTRVIGNASMHSNQNVRVDCDDVLDCENRISLSQGIVRVR